MNARERTSSYLRERDPTLVSAAGRDRVEEAGGGACGGA